jgi:hypothetical protein
MLKFSCFVPVDSESPARVSLTHDDGARVEMPKKKSNKTTVLIGTYGTIPPTTKY